jgi:tRNA threonylcarbamoyladenosine biosynthesis protein TsaB
VKPQSSLTLLAIETSSDVGTVCLLNTGAQPWVRIEMAATGIKLSDWILPAIDRLLSAAGETLAHIDAIAFGSGPGAFTGVRTACATAQALAYAHAKPLVAVSSMEALAALVDASHVTVVLDARMGEIYVAAYQRDAHRVLTETMPPRVAKPADIEHTTATSLFIGSGVPLLPNANARATNAAAMPLQNMDDASLQQRWAEGVARGALTRLQRGECVDPLSAEPSYVRNKVALTEVERALA